MAAKTGAQRQAALRSKGRQVAVVLRNPEAIAALDALAAECGGVTAAITRALVDAGATTRGSLGAADSALGAILDPLNKAEAENKAR